MTVTWGLDLDRPAGDDARWLVEQAWAAWLKESCVERHGGHLWRIELLSVEDGGGVDLSCEYCPAGVDDLCPDGGDLVFGEVDGIPIEYGRQRSLQPYEAPVGVKLVHESHYSWLYGGWEHDLWIVVKRRYPGEMPPVPVDLTTTTKES